MTEYRKALPHEEADVLDFINYVFSHAHRPHDFKKLLPKVYAHEGFYRWHYVAVNNGRIRGVVGVWPVEMRVNEKETLRIGYVGSVSAHPYDKGAGHMKKLMQLMLEDAKDRYDLLVLGGQRQRYEYFGFECGGTKLQFEVNESNVRHALGDTACRMRLREIVSTNDPVLDNIHALCSKKAFCCVRERKKLLDIMHSWQGKLCAIEDEDGLQGYLCTVGEDFLAEIGLTDESRIGELIKSYMEWAGQKKVQVRVNPLNRVRGNYLKAFAEKWVLSDNAKMHVINWKKVLSVLLMFKADCQPLSDGRFVFEVENEGRYAIEVKAHHVRVADAQEEPQMVLTHNKAVEFFFSSYTALMITSPMLKSWLPVPFDMYSADEF